MNLAITVGNAATYVIPGAITRAYADSVLRRTANPGADEVKISRVGNLTSIARSAGSWPALWRQSLLGLAHVADAVSASAPVQVLAKGVEWMHTAVLYDGLRDIVETSLPWESRSAAEAIRSLGRDYIEDAVRRLLRMDEVSDVSFRRIAQLGDPAILVLRRIIETEPNLRTAAINSLYHMSGSPAAGEALGDLMNNYHTDVRFAVARVIVGEMTKDGQGSLRIVSAFSGIIPTAFKVYGEFVLAMRARSKGHARADLLRPYEENVHLLIQGGYVQREAVIQVLTALLTAPDAVIDLRREAVHLLFYFDSRGHSSYFVPVSWVEEPALWARDQEDPLLRLAYLANLAEINRPQENWRRQMVVPHIGQLYGKATGNTIGLIDTRTGVEKIYPRNPNWHGVVRQFQDWERSGRNDPRVIAAAQTILDGGEFTYQMVFREGTTGATGD